MRRPALFVALALAAGPAVAEPPPIKPLVTRWNDCVVQSFATQRAATPDASMAAEAALAACQSEENLLFASRPLSPQDAYRYRALYRAKLKALLLGGG